MAYGLPLRVFQVQPADGIFRRRQDADGQLGFPGLNSGPGISGPPDTGGLLGLSLQKRQQRGVNGQLGNNNVGANAFGDGLDVGRCNCPLTESEQQFQFVNNWTRTQGNHTIKFGADIRYAENLRVPSDQSRTGLC